MKDFRVFAAVAMSIWWDDAIYGMGDDETSLKLVVIFGEPGKGFSKKMITKGLDLEKEGEVVDFVVELVNCKKYLIDLIRSSIAEHNESISSE